MTDPKRQRGEQGLDEALDGLRIALQSTGRDPLIAFTESMAWLYYVREWHKNNLPDLHPRSNATDAGKTFQAIIWARGLDTHGSRDVADLIVDVSSSGILGAGVLGTFVLGSPARCAGHGSIARIFRHRLESLTAAICTTRRSSPGARFSIR